VSEGFKDPTERGWRPPLYNPRVEYVWFDGKQRLRQQPIVICPCSRWVHVYALQNDEITVHRWRSRKATTMFWLGCAACKELLAESLVDESMAITASTEARPDESPAYYRREARRKRQQADSLGRLLHHLKVAIRRAVG
jgi:hypothetical protein